MADSIREFFGVIKARFSGFVSSDAGSDLLVAGVIILVGFGAFGLGRLSAERGEGAPITMTMAATTTAPLPLPMGGRLVASRTGSKYYYPWCGGAKSISAANLIWFDTEAAAQKAGYAPAGNCKGLAP